MKNRISKITRHVSNLYMAGGVLVLLLLGGIMGCQKSDLITGTPSGFDEMRLHNSDFTTVNLVADVNKFNPVYLDNYLVNACGLAFSDNGEAWVGSVATGVSMIYDANGVTLAPPVGIPFGLNPTAGNVTGMIYNTTNKFVIPATGEISEFIFATQNGTLAAWNSGHEAVTVADRSGQQAMYTGMTYTRTMSGAYYIYVTDFRNGKVDVYDENFTYMNVHLNDPDLPAAYAPFNIKAIDGLLYVTYAQRSPLGAGVPDIGPGNGYIDVFQPNGSFVMRFASNGSLNVPWGITQTSGLQKSILVGNFGDGRISVFTSDGRFESYLRNETGDPVEIEGLWAIEFPNGNFIGDENNRLYFTAGPDNMRHGVFGYLNPN